MQLRSLPGVGQRSLTASEFGRNYPQPLHAGYFCRSTRANFNSLLDRRQPCKAITAAAYTLARLIYAMRTKSKE